MSENGSHRLNEGAGSTRSRRLRLLRDYGITALIIAVMMFIAYRYLLVYGKSNVWEGDGVAQSFPEIYFINTWIRGILRHPELGVPLWSWNMGLGADIIGTLAFPIAGDPFALLSLVFPMKQMETALLAIYLIRVFCAGLVSAAYFRVMGAKALPAAVGAILYVFTAFLLFITLRHPFFVNAMVFLPLMLIAAEFGLQGRRLWLLTAVVCIAAFANFYFFYMLTIVVVLYTVLRYFETTERDDRWPRLMPTALRVGGYYLLGIVLAAPMLAPAGAAVMATARSQTEYSTGLLYSGSVYRALLAGLGSAQPGPIATYMGFGALGLLMVAVLFVRRGANTAVKTMILVLTVSVCIPFVGAVFNGLTFPSNRFAFSLGAFVALAAALRLSDNRAFDSLEVKAMAAFLAVYGVLLAVLVRPLGPHHVLPVVLGAVSVLVLAGERRMLARTGSREGRGPAWLPLGWRTSTARWVVIGLLVVNVGANAMFLHGTRYQDMLKTFVDRGVVFDLFRHNLGSVAKKLPLSVGARITNARTVGYNSSMVQGFPGTSYYFSTMSESLTAFRTEIDSRPGWSGFSYDGFDERVMPMTMLGVEYFVTDKRGRPRVPFGFSQYKRSGEAIVYRNDNVLPLGYVYDDVIARSDYERLDPVDRQDAMLQGAVVDDADVGSLPRILPVSGAIRVPYSVASTTGATFDRAAGTIVRTEPDSSIVLSITPVPEAELYVEIRDFDNVVKAPNELDAAKGLSAFDAWTLRNLRSDFTQPREIRTRYSAGRVSKTEVWQSPASNYYWGNRSQLVNLGYAAKGRASVTIRPEQEGTLTFQSLGVFAVPMNRYQTLVEKLKSSPLRGIEIGTNRVSGTVSSPRAGMLFLSIPYSSGWTAKLDGAPVRVVRVNTGFSGVPITAGEHAVTLEYFSPGLKWGLVVGAIGWCVVAILALSGVYRARKRKRIA